jgi:predicted metalloendopeptidase
MFLVVRGKTYLFFIYSFIFSDLLSSESPSGTVEINATVNARRMYASCVNEDAIETEGFAVMLSFINRELGGWPILQGSTWDESTFDLPRLLVKLCEYSDYSSSIIFKAGTEIDAKNSSHRSIRVSQEGLALEDRTYYLTESNITQAYRKFMKDIALTLTNDISMIDNDVNSIYAFEQLISKVIIFRCKYSLSHFFPHSTFGHIPNKMHVMKKLFEQHSSIYRQQ